MTVRLELSLVVEHAEGAEPTPVERSLAEHIAWVNREGPYSIAYHEVMAHLALVAARDHWRQADLFRRLDAERTARTAAGKARRRAHD